MKRTTLEIELTPTGYRWTVVLGHSTIAASGSADTEWQAAVAGGLALLKLTSPLSQKP